MSENKRFMEIGQRVTVDFDEESYYLDGEYWESWDNYGEEMADAINKEFNKLAEENEQLKSELKDYSDANARLEEKIQRQLRENKRLHRDWDKLYQLCLDNGVTEEEIIQEMER